MRRRWSTVLWLGIGIVCGAAGCSGEPVPPLVAINSQSDEWPKPTDSFDPTADAVEPQTVGLGRPAPVAQETVDVNQAPGMEVPTISDQVELPRDLSEVQGCNRRISETAREDSDATAWGHTRPDAERHPKGALIMAGGGLRYDNAEVWSRFVKLAADYARESGEPDGTRPRIAVFPTAALHPQQTAIESSPRSRDLGATATSSRSRSRTPLPMCGKQSAIPKLWSRLNRPTASSSQEASRLGSSTPYARPTVGKLPHWRRSGTSIAKAESSAAPVPARRQ